MAPGILSIALGERTPVVITRSRSVALVSFCSTLSGAPSAAGSGVFCSSGLAAEPPRCARVPEFVLLIRAADACAPALPDVPPRRQRQPRQWIRRLGAHLLETNWSCLCSEASFC